MIGLPRRVTAGDEHMKELPAGVAGAQPSAQMRASARGTRNVWERWQWGWHAIAYLMLAIASVDALALTQRSPDEKAAILGWSLLFGAWYAVCVIVRYDAWRRHAPALAVYLVAGWAIWVRLASLEMAYMFLLAALYPQIFGLLGTAGKIAAAAALGALSIGLQAAASGAFSPIYALVTVFASVAAIFLALFISAIIDQSHERQRLIEELKAARDELAAAERQAGMLAERQRLAREIHDTLAQGFASIVLHLEAAEASLSPVPPPARQHLDRARDTARDNLAEARRMVWALRPESLERGTLADALKRLGARWSEESGAAASVAITGAPRPLPTDVEVALLRAAQEALSNIRKHARARQATLTLSYMDDAVNLDVQDDGLGFDPQRLPTDAQAGGYGLRAMRERVESMGGTWSIESAPGEGATLAVSLPAPGGAEREDRP
jgi:signal transduction histidine kinase